MATRQTNKDSVFIFSAWGALAVASVLFGTALALKLAKLSGLEAEITWWEGVKLCASDASLAVGTALAAGLLSLVLRRFAWGGWLVHGLVLLWITPLQGLAVIEHGSWESTGTLIDWNILGYTLRHFSELSSVVGEEMSSERGWFFVWMFALGLVPLAVDLVFQFAARIAAQMGRLSLAVLGALLAAALVVGRLPVPDMLAPIAHNAPFTLALDAITSLVGLGEDAVEEGLVPENELSDTAGAMQWHEQVMASAASVRWKRPGTKPLNVVFVIVESGRFDATTPYRPELKTTPTMARLAEHGMVVEKAYTDVPHTSKALVGFMCGYPPRYTFEIQEAQAHGLPMPCLAHYLRNLGYRTGFFQAASGTFESRRQMVDNLGFHDFFSRDSYSAIGFEKTNYLGIEDRVMLQPALDWVDDDPDTPFFLTFLTIISHHNYGLPSSWKRTRLAPKGLSGKYDRYLNTIAYIDAFAGEFLDGLAERGLLDNTLVVMFGDHGQAFEEHGRKHHNDVIYEEGLRVPLVFSNAMLFKEGRRVGGKRRLADVPPTVLSLIGAEYPAEAFEGENILDSEGHERVYSACWYKDRCAAEISGSVKVIDHFERRGMEAFDLEEDPGETNNLLKLPGKEGEQWREAALAARARIRARHVEIEGLYRDAAKEMSAPYLLEEEPVPDFPVKASFGEVVELLGYDLASHEAAPGSGLDITVYFKCLKPTEPGWKLLGHLQTVDRQIRKSDHDPAGSRLTLDQCQAGSFVADRVRLWIPPNFPLGKATYYWGVYKKKKRTPVKAISPGLKADKERLALLDVDVVGPHPPELEEFLDESVSDEPFPSAQRLDVHLGDNLVLEGVSFEPTSRVRRRNSLVVSTVWRVEGPLESDWRIFMHLYPKKGKMQRQDHSPVKGMLPVADWKPGTWVRDRHTIFISPRWPLGEAVLWGGLFRGDERLEVTDPGSAQVDKDGRIKLGTFQIAR